MVSTGHVGGTRGPGIVSSAADVLWMSVVFGMRGVGGVCEMCMCLARGCVGGDGDEWMRGLGLGFTHPVGTGGVLGVCRCLGCGGVGSVSWGWVGAWIRVWRDGYLYIVLVEYRCNLGTPSVQSCCTLWISASFFYDIHSI